ncbi:MAG: hypothetical protein MJ052_03105 [Sphaerochaetaceae bacterium]|nr:hypothetical protein [Sphaerochaetaceae bacterium]
MKNKLLLLVFLPVVSVLLFSCNMAESNIENSTALAYASFDNSAARDLNQSYSGYQAYNQLYWYYSAEKADSYGLTGQTKTAIDNVETLVVLKVPGDTTYHKGLSGKIGPFSEGKWNIRVFATSETLVSAGEYSEMHDGSNTEITYYLIPTENVVYAGNINNVVLRRNQTNYIPVTVSPQGNTGKIVLADNLHYSYQNGAGNGTLFLEASGTARVSGSTTDTEVKFASKELTESDGAYYLSTDRYLKLNSSENIPTGIYSVVFAVKTSGDDVYELQSQRLTFKVMGGLTTVISGDLIEGLSYENYFTVAEQDVKIFEAVQSGSTIEANAVPKANALSSDKTVVSFPAGALDSAFNTQYTLQVIAMPQQIATGKFSVTSDTKAVVAGLELILTQIVASNDSSSVVEKGITSFNNQYVQVRTYIDTNLENVNVKYNGTNASPPVYEKTGNSITTFAEEASLYSSYGKTGYVPSTGLLVFMTDHFSDFYVTADTEAKILETNRVFTNLDTAFSEVADGQTIRLTKNVTRNSGLLFNKDISATLDLNSKTLKVTGSISAVDGGRAIKVTSGMLTVKNGTIDGRSYLNGQPNDNPTYGGPWSSTRTGGCIRVSGGDCVLENLNLFNNDGWGNAIKLESYNSIEMRNCTVNSVYGAGLEAGYGTVDIYSCTFNQSKLANKKFMSSCIAVCALGTVNIHDTNISLEIPETNADGVYALYIYDSGGIINIDGGTYYANSLQSIHVDGASLASYLNEELSFDMALKENNAYLDNDAIRAKRSSLTAKQMAEFDTCVAKYDSFAAAHGGKTSVMNVNGGIFGGNIYVTQNGIAAPYAQLNIKGGTFSIDPSTWVSAGHSTRQENANWIVSPTTVE